MDHSRPKRLVIIPAFNEADSVADVVAQVRAHLPDFDVLVIDDGSTDGTARAVPPTATVLSLPFNQGIGGAMQTGYRFAALHGYDLAIQIDGDGQHPADQAARLVEHLQTSGADMVVGSRFLQTEGYRPPRSRMTAIHMLRALMWLLTGRRITDVTSGFRAANRRAIHAFAHWYPEDYPEPEVIMLLLRAGYDVQETPVRMAPRLTGQSSISFFAGVFYLIKVSAALLLDLVRDPWPQAKVTPP